MTLMCKDSYTECVSLCYCRHTLCSVPALKAPTPAPTFSLVCFQMAMSLLYVQHATRTHAHRGSCGNGRSFRLTMPPPSYCTIQQKIGSKIASGATALCDGKWHHVAVTLAPSAHGYHCSILVNARRVYGPADAPLFPMDGLNVVVGQYGSSRE